MELEIIEYPVRGPRVVLVLDGRLFTATAPELKARLKRLAEDGKADVVLDMSRVSFVDSSGLAALIAGLKTAQQFGGSLRLAGVRDQALMAFRTTMLDRVFEFYPDVESATQAGNAR